MRYLPFVGLVAPLLVFITVILYAALLQLVSTGARFSHCRGIEGKAFKCHSSWLNFSILAVVTLALPLMNLSLFLVCRPALFSGLALLAYDVLWDWAPRLSLWLCTSASLALVYGNCGMQIWPFVWRTVAFVPFEVVYLTQLPLGLEVLSVVRSHARCQNVRCELCCGEKKNSSRVSDWHIWVFPNPRELGKQKRHSCVILLSSTAGPQCDHHFAPVDGAQCCWMLRHNPTKQQWPCRIC